MAWSKTKKLKFLNQQPVIRVATVGRSGRPQVTPVCHVVSGGKIYWASYLDASIQQAQAAMDVTAGHLVQAFPEAYKDLA